MFTRFIDIVHMRLRKKAQQKRTVCKVLCSLSDWDSKVTIIESFVIYLRCYLKSYRKSYDTWDKENLNLDQDSKEDSMAAKKRKAIIEPSLSSNDKH